MECGEDTQGRGLRQLGRAGLTDEKLFPSTIPFTLSPSPAPFSISSFSFFPYILPSLGSILTNLPFLGYLCQKHNVTMEITRTLMLDGPGVKPHPGPPSSCVPLEKLVKFSEMLFPCVSEHRGVED